jgi:8-oxo-dGTP pyrophosphatase MutT (NUDIX family)
MAERKRNRRGGERRRRKRAAIETSSGGVVFRRVEEVPHFLLIRDPYHNWGLPKGHIEGQETPAEAALREVTEETGLDALEIVAELPTIDWYYRDHGRLIHKYCHFFLLESDSGETRPQLDEGITDCIWRPFPSALETLSYANAREVLRAAGERLDNGATVRGTGGSAGSAGNGAQARG